MKVLNLLIKPASSGCNLRCKYCFYYDVAENRAIKNYGIMKEETLKNLVSKVFKEVELQVNFAFQGGEPTLAGIDFFHTFHKYVELFNTNKINVNFSLQTNGTLINKNWVSLFKKYNYLIGLSLDGNKETHNIFRLDAKEQGTFSTVFKTMKLLKKENIPFNILTVVNKVTAKNAKLIYTFFRNNGLKYFQFIPCLDEFNNEKKEFSLSSEDYGKFLNDIFQLWYEDVLNNKFVSIRYFDNLIKILLGEEPESCDMVGHCNLNAIVEADGSIYPCDFYVLDEYNLGNINNLSFSEILFSKKEKDFLESSMEVLPKCKNCKYLSLCRGGCRRHKEPAENGLIQNRFCDSYINFFDQNFEKLLEIAKYVINIRKNSS